MAATRKTGARKTEQIRSAAARGQVTRTIIAYRPNSKTIPRRIQCNRCTKVIIGLQAGNINIIAANISSAYGCLQAAAAEVPVGKTEQTHSAAACCSVSGTIITISANGKEITCRIKRNGGAKVIGTGKTGYQR
jgi:hypothetical protein